MDTRVSQIEQHMVDLGADMRRLMEVMQAGRVAIPAGGAHNSVEGPDPLAQGL